MRHPAPPIPAPPIPALPIPALPIPALTAALALALAAPAAASPAAPPPTPPTLTPPAAVSAPLLRLQQDSTLEGFLPAPEPGRTLTLDPVFAAEMAGMGVPGTGSRVEGVYRGPQGAGIRVQNSHNAMHRMYAWFRNLPGGKETFGTVHVVQGREAMVFRGDDRAGTSALLLLGNGIAIQTAGGTREERLEMIDRIDLDALEGFGA